MILRYLSYFVLPPVLVVVLMLIWPKGSLESQMKRAKVPAIGYGIIESGAWEKIQVVGELEAGQAAPESAIFNIASVTKPVFSLVVLKLIEAGTLGLDEPLHPYWVDPDVADDPRHKLLTARLLLSHQSGFPNWRWNSFEKKLAFMVAPGTTYNYSGEGMEYLRHAIEAKTEKTLTQLADSLLFEPLEMHDTRFIWDEGMDESRFAKGHNETGQLYEFHRRTTACAADDLMTTVADLGRFAIYVMEQAGLSDSLYQEMVTPQVMISERSGYGLGWEVAPNLPNGEYALVHGGSDQGVRARLVVMPQSKRAFLAFANGDKGQQLLDRLMVKEFEPGADLLSQIYAPLIWRIIHLPFDLPM